MTWSSHACKVNISNLYMHGQLMHSQYLSMQGQLMPTLAVAINDAKLLGN